MVFEVQGERKDVSGGGSGCGGGGVCGSRWCSRCGGKESMLAMKAVGVGVAGGGRGRRKMCLLCAGGATRAGGPGGHAGAAIAHY